MVRSLLFSSQMLQRFRRPSRFISKSLFGILNPSFAALALSSHLLADPISLLVLWSHPLTPTIKNWRIFFCLLQILFYFSSVLPLFQSLARLVFLLAKMLRISPKSVSMQLWEVPHFKSADAVGFDPLWDPWPLFVEEASNDPSSKFRVFCSPWHRIVFSSCQLDLSSSCEYSLAHVLRLHRPVGRILGVECLWIRCHFLPSNMLWPARF